MIVNMLIDKSQVNDKSPDFVRNRVKMQARYMDDIWQKFEGMVRSLVLLYDNEVRGVETLSQTAESLLT